MIFSCYYTALGIFIVLDLHVHCTGLSTEEVNKLVLDHHSSATEYTDRLTSFPSQMPSKRKGVQVVEQFDSECSASELLDCDPQVTSHVVH